MSITPLWNVSGGSLFVRWVRPSRDRIEARNGEPTIYQLDVSITNDSPRRPVVIAGYRLLPPWNDEYISLLPDPHEAVPRASEYKTRSWAIGRPRDEVLNHRVNDKGKLAVGDNITGTLLFQGTQPIPQKLGAEVEVELQIYLADGKVFPAKCELKIDRGFEGRIVQPSGRDLLAG